MTTMELNLRKTDLFSMINSMDEEDVTMVEKFIKRLRTAKREVSYPWNPTGEELHSCVREAREDVLYGRCISDEDLTEEMKAW
ncbi:hypothetical protein [Parabacteroides sp.]